MPGKPRVLLVDDDRQYIRGTGIRLRAAGFDVVAACDGRIGLDLATSEHPDVIVLDVQMPGMDGLAVLAELRRREQTRHVPVLMVSACVDRREAALDQGARHFLEKPLDSRTLISAIENLIEYPRTAEEARC